MKDSDWFVNGVIEINKLSKTGGDLDKLAKTFVEFGCHLFNMEVGIVSEIFDKTYKVIYANPNDLNIKVNDAYELQNTFCREVVSTKEIICHCDIPSNKQLNTHPAFTELKLKSYIGLPIFVSGNLFGTLNFSSTSIKPDGLPPNSIILLELLSQMLGSLLEKKNDKKIQGHFLKNLAHDLRNPLNGILGYTELLRDLDHDEETVELMTFLAKSSEDLEKKLRDLTIYTETSLLKRDQTKEVISLQNICHEMVEKNLSRSENVRTTYNIDPGHMVKSNHHLTEVIIELLYRDCLDRKQGQKEITISSQIIDGATYLTVEDNGPALAQEPLEYLSTFQPHSNKLLTLHLPHIPFQLNLAKIYCDSAGLLLKGERKEKGGVKFILKFGPSF